MDGYRKLRLKRQRRYGMLEKHPSAETCKDSSRPLQRLKQWLSSLSQLLPGHQYAKAQLRKEARPP